MPIQVYSGVEEDRALTRSTEGWNVRQEAPRAMRLGGQKGMEHGEETIMEL